MQYYFCFGGECQFGLECFVGIYVVCFEGVYQLFEVDQVVFVVIGQVVLLVVVEFVDEWVFVGVEYCCVIVCDCVFEQWCVGLQYFYCQWLEGGQFVVGQGYVVWFVLEYMFVFFVGRFVVVVVVVDYWLYVGLG